MFPPRQPTLVHPILFHVGNIYLPTFGVLAASGLICALLLSERTAKLAVIDPPNLWNAGLFAVIAAFVFSRALLLAQHWRSFREFPLLLLAVPSLTASGLLLTLIAVFLCLWLKRIPLRRALDAWAPCATLAWAFLALGHFAEGSDPGLRGRPVALYAAAVAALITIASLAQLRRPRPPGETAGLTLIAAGVGQFLLSFIRVPGVKFAGVLDVLQGVALAMIVAGAALVVTIPAILE